MTPKTSLPPPSLASATQYLNSLVVSYWFFASLNSSCSSRGLLKPAVEFVQARNHHADSGFIRATSTNFLPDCHL